MKLFRKHWGVFLLCAILGLIVVLNFRPGYFVLGNDNFSPELNPGLTLQRSIYSPAYRTYRVLGIPSDSEQSDVFRTSMFFIFEKVLPMWLVSQGYLFFTFIIASISMGALVSKFAHKIFGKHVQLAFFLGGLFYTANMLTSWIYFFPVHLFVAAYAFLPFVLWRLWCFFEHQSTKNVFLLLFSSLLLSTSALTATMFFMVGLVVCLFGIMFVFMEVRGVGGVRAMKISAVGLFIVLGVQLFWLLPFFTYVKSNTKDLQQSSINRDITSTTIENEIKHNTAFNSLRYYSSWMDTKEDNKNYTFPYRDWYTNNFLAQILSFIPYLLALEGGLLLFVKKQKPFLVIPLLTILGWFLIKGINPPFGFIFQFLQDHSSVFAQVFRWQSSKMWPFLAGSIPILATLGALGFFTRLHISRKRDSVIFIFVLTLCMLFFVFPYFKGDLVRQKVFVQVPQEYFDLSSYLSQNDSFSRIYPAPEANTLYFRNYSWGFWGSVVLNYIIPNPVIEKALIIGSKENEQAFTVIKNAYYSENPKIFASALRTYQTPFVLWDSYAARGDVGYPYDLNVEQKVIEQNPDIIKVWEEGNLALYKLKDNQTSFPPLGIAQKSDFASINTIKSSLFSSFPNVSGQNIAGDILPFGLQFDSFEFRPTEVVAKSSYDGPNSIYSLTADANDLSSSPSKLSYFSAQKLLNFEPLYPQISVNSTDYKFSFPRKQFTLKNDPAFLGINNEVVDRRAVSDNSAGIDVSFSQIDSASSITSWSADYVPFDLLSQNQAFFHCKNTPDSLNIPVAQNTRVKCQSVPIVVNKPTVAEVFIGMQSTHQVEAVLCIQSKYQDDCLNKERSILVGKPGISSLVIPREFQNGDTITVYLDFIGQSNASVQLGSLMLHLFQDSSAPQFLGEEIVPSQNFTIPINKGDKVALHIPLFSGFNGWRLAQSNFLPEISFASLDDSAVAKVTESKDGSIHITDKESNTSVFPKFSLVNPNGGLGMVIAESNHESGIPVKITLRDVNKEYNLWEELTQYKTKTESLSLFMIPDEIRSYVLEAFSTGIGPRPSGNTISQLIFEVIPKSWYSLRLVNASQNTLSVQKLFSSSTIETNSYKGSAQTGSIITIPDAVSPNWEFEVSGNSQKNTALINGWEQAWFSQKSGDAKAWFGPNNLVYIGFIPLILVVGWIVWSILKIALKR